MKFIKSLLVSILLLSLLVIATQCSKKVVESQDKLVPVKLADIRTEDVSIPIHGSGMLVTIEQIRLSFKTGGIVEKVAVREGATVRKGQLLAQLELDEINAQVQQAESGYEKAKRDYDRIVNLYADAQL